MYTGIDIDKRFAEVAVIDEDGTLSDETCVKNTDLDAFTAEYNGSEVAMINFYALG